jgi:hypothetical protein
MEVQSLTSECSNILLHCAFVSRRNRAAEPDLLPVAGKLRDCSWPVLETKEPRKVVFGRDLQNQPQILS